MLWNEFMNILNFDHTFLLVKEPGMWEEQSMLVA